MPLVEAAIAQAFCEVFGAEPFVPPLVTSHIAPAT
jgi:hypothetical protein